MAELVLGLATSHSPLLSTPPECWDLRAKADRTNPQHHFRGRVYDFDTLIWERAPGFANQTTIDVRRERYERCQRALDELARRFTDATPDAVIIVGNDQREIFSDSLTPAITVYRGERIENVPFTKEEPSPGLAIAEHGNCPVGGATYPGAPELADHVIESLIEDDFDVAESSSLPRSVLRPGIPHAYGFVYHPVLGAAPPPSVHIIFNVHYPPNRPLLRRCLALGRGNAAPSEVGIVLAALRSSPRVG